MLVAPVLLVAAAYARADEPPSTPQPTPTPVQEKAAAPATAEPEASPTPAGLANTLRWTTASEVDNFGYDVYRATKEDGPFERVTKEPIPGAGTTDEPHDYVWVDTSIDPGQGYYYYIESISMSGVREKFSPVQYAKPKGATQAKPEEQPAKPGS